MQACSKTRSPNSAPVFLVLLITVTITGCAADRPCDPRFVPDTYAAAPPHECRVNGCSLAPDFNFPRCCDTHDARYWAGGTADERKQADRRFRECIATTGHRALSNLYYFGVRIGGTPYLPTPWRWGFGWNYPHGYEPLLEVEGSGGYP